MNYIYSTMKNTSHDVAIYIYDHRYELIIYCVYVTSGQGVG